MKLHLLILFTFYARLLGQPISVSVKTASAPSKGRPQHLLPLDDPPSPTESDWIKSGQLRPKLSCLALLLFVSLFFFPATHFFIMLFPLNLDLYITLKAYGNSSNKNCPESVWKRTWPMIQNKRHQKLQKI